MSDLSSIGINTDVTEDSGIGAGGQIVPNGKYKVVMVAESLEDNNNKNGKVLKTKMQIIEGKFENTILYDNINITNPSKICQDIGQGVLKRICRITAITFPPPDMTLAFGKPMLATVNVKPKWNDATKKQNEIVAYNQVPADFVAEDKPAVTAVTDAKKILSDTNEAW